MNSTATVRAAVGALEEIQSELGTIPTGAAVDLDGLAHRIVGATEKLFRRGAVRESVDAALRQAVADYQNDFRTTFSAAVVAAMDRVVAAIGQAIRSEAAAPAATGTSLSLNQASRAAETLGAGAITDLMAALGTDDLGALGRIQVASTVLNAGASTWMEPTVARLTAAAQRDAARIVELEAQLADIRSTAEGIRDRAQHVMERVTAETILSKFD